MASISSGAIRSLSEQLKASASNAGPSVGTDATGTVTRTGSPIYVRIDGDSISDTPMTASTVGVSVGDVVRVHIEGGDAIITGNISAPSTDDTAANAASAKASEVASVANVAKADAIVAKAAASDAAALAEQAAADAAEAAKTSAHFWHDDRGAHVSSAPNVLTGAHVNIDTDSLDMMVDDTTVASFRSDGTNGSMLGQRSIVMSTQDMIGNDGEWRDFGIGFTLLDNGTHQARINAESLLVNGMPYVDPTTYTEGKITAYNSWTHAYPILRRNNATGIVQFGVTISKTNPTFTAGTAFQVAAIPSGFRPDIITPLSIAFYSTSGASTAFWSGWVNSAGAVYVRRNTAASGSVTNVRIGCTYFVA